MFGGFSHKNLHRVNKLRRVLVEPSYRRALRQGVAAGTEHEKVVFPHEYQTVIDVGANRGQFALFALCRFPDAFVYCFEPLPQAYQKLMKIVGKYGQVRAQQCAIGAVRGSLHLNVARSDDSSSVLQPTALQQRTFHNTDAVAAIEVPVETLDNVIAVDNLSLPFLLKIDVQGFELEVLKGCQALLQEKGDILVEVSFVELYGGQALADEVVTWLLPLGYRLVGVYSLIKDHSGLPLQADFLFTHTESSG